jgi:hypothetical protein
MVIAPADLEGLWRLQVVMPAQHPARVDYAS